MGLVIGLNNFKWFIVLPALDFQSQYCFVRPATNKRLEAGLANITL